MSESRTSTVHTIPVTLNDGTEAVLGERFGGKVLLVVNVASKCGLTPQYEGLEELYQTFRAEGLEILGVPCNQFMGQEPGTDPEIGEFCKVNYGVTFPLAAKTEVNGEATHPLYQALKAYPSGSAEDISWNFEKFLIGRDGDVIGRFAPRTEPLSEEVTAAVRAAL
ncbi:glutathione peroxidase [Arthrobacter ginkgonis]|uniref:Glutathione peroxidase n=1 Tax=Arthrobacter ginkgonis TaxID=1630594 RepID=A0ABP7BWF3_9MICC